MSNKPHIDIFLIVLLVTVFFSDLRGQSYCDDSLNIDDKISITQNWHSVFVEATAFVNTNEIDPSDFERVYFNYTGQSFKNLFNDTGKLVYLDFSLHQQFSAEDRDIFWASLSEDLQKALFDSNLKIESGELQSSISEHEDFSPCSFYLFEAMFPTNEQVSETQKLLENWTESLDEAYALDPMWGSLKARTIITGYFKLNDFQRVHTLGRYFLNSNELPPSYDTLFFLNYIAYSSIVSGYYRDALRMYSEQIIPVAEQLGDISELLISRMDYANVLFRLGNVNLAKQEYEAVFEQEEFLTNQSYRTALFNNLAITYLNAGNFDRYIEFQLDAYNIAMEEENIQYQLSILRNLHIFYRRNRNPELAFDYISEALDLATRYELRSEIPSILISMGVHSRESLGKYDQALDFLSEAREITEQMDRYLDNIQALIETARTYSQKGNFSEARIYFRQALDASEQRDDIVRAASTAFRLADMYLEEGYYDDAREIAAQYASVSMDILTFNIAVTAQNVNHKLLIRDGEHAEALESSRKLIDEITAWLRESADSQTGHMRLDPEFSEAYRIHHNLLHEKELFEEQIVVNEQFRSISRSAFFNNPLLKSNVLNEEELLLDFALGNRIQRLRRQLAEAEGQERIQISNDLLTAVSRRSQLLDRIFPFAVDEDEPVDMAEIQRSLGRRDIIMYFSVQNEEVFQTHITRRNISSVKHEDSARLYQLIREAQLSFGPGTTDLNKLHEIYSIVFADTDPASYRHIYVVPDGSFYQIPFEILPVTPPNSVNSFGSTTFLLEKASISYLNTAKDLLSERTSANQDFSYGYAGFGLSDFRAAGHQNLSNLPFAPQEVVRSASALSQIKPAVTFLNEESTRSRFNELAGNSRILHLATHSIIENEDPLFSALYLHQSVYDSGNGSQVNDDGVVRAYNLFDVNLSADLVVLSSCESARGEYLAGSGILGLSRAFSYAGAQSLLMNLWPVKDQTASQITSRFFTYLDSGTNKAESLRSARLDYLNNVNSDPFLWGGYVMHGNIAPVYSDNRFIKITAVSLGILLVLVMLQLTFTRVRLRNKR